MKESFITINNNDIELPSGEYADRNAQSLLVTGHIFHSILNKNDHSPLAFNCGKDDTQEIIEALMDNEEWLMSTIKSLGELIAAVKQDELEERSLSSIGYLISTLTELFCLTQHAARLIQLCVDTNKDGLS